MKIIKRFFRLMTFIFVVVLFVTLSINVSSNSAVADKWKEIRGYNSTYQMIVWWPTDSNVEWYYTYNTEISQTFYFDQIDENENIYQLLFGYEEDNLCVGIDEEMNVCIGINEQLETQFWKVERISHTQYYKITNLSNGKCIRGAGQKKNGKNYMYAADYDESDNSFKLWLR